MSTSITTAFITDYNTRVHEAYQRRAAYLMSAVRHKANVIGSTSVFYIMGKGTAVTKARHGTITPMNQAHTSATATLADFYAGDWVDKLDEAKVNIDERQLIADGGAMALGRKVDDQIIAAMNGTSTSTPAWTLSAAANVRNELLGMTETLWANDVPNDGMVYGLLTSKAWAHAMTVQEFSRSDWVGSDGLPFTQGTPTGGKWKDWQGVKWGMHTGLPGHGTSSANVYVWHKSSIGYASAKSAGNVAGNGPVSADITWHGDRASHFVNHLMSGGAVLIDANGVVESSLDDTTALATS